MPVGVFAGRRVLRSRTAENRSEDIHHEYSRNLRRHITMCSKPGLILEVSEAIDKGIKIGALLTRWYFVAIVKKKKMVLQQVPSSMY